MVQLIIDAVADIMMVQGIAMIMYHIEIIINHLMMTMMTMVTIMAMVMMTAMMTRVMMSVTIT